MFFYFCERTGRNICLVTHGQMLPDIFPHLFVECAAGSDQLSPVSERPAGNVRLILIIRLKNTVVAPLLREIGEEAIPVIQPCGGAQGIKSIFRGTFADEFQETFRKIIRIVENRFRGNCICNMEIAVVCRQPFPGREARNDCGTRRGFLRDQRPEVVHDRRSCPYLLPHLRLGGR